LVENLYYQPTTQVRHHDLTRYKNTQAVRGFLCPRLERRKGDGQEMVYVCMYVCMYVCVRYAISGHGQTETRINHHSNAATNTYYDSASSPSFSVQCLARVTAVQSHRNALLLQWLHLHGVARVLQKETMSKPIRFRPLLLLSSPPSSRLGPKCTTKQNTRINIPAQSARARTDSISCRSNIPYK
jgi:hypothetical protein